MDAAQAGHLPRSPHVDASRFWAGAVATAAVAALVGVVGVLITTVPGIDPVSPGWLVGDTGRGSDAERFALTAALAALLAAGLLYLLLLGVPRPRTFFGWIIGLATVAAATSCFKAPADLDQQVAAAVITVAVGVAVGSLLSGVASWSVSGPGRSAADLESY